MSKAISASAMGSRRWLNMAFTMGRILGDIASGKKMEVPMAVWRDAQKFFRIVLKEKKTDGIMFDNPPAQLNTRYLAQEVLSSCNKFGCETEKEADSHFKKFAALLGELNDELNRDKIMKPLSPEGLETAKELQKFFLALYQLGVADTRD